jgi:hypothetical protein
MKLWPVADVDLNFSPYDAIDPNLFNVDQDDPIRAQIADLTGLLDPEYLREALNASLDRSRAAMAAGCAGMPEPILAEDDGLWISFEAAAAHAEISKDVTKEMLAKVWRISEDEARRTLEVTTQLNRQGADTSLSRQAGNHSWLDCRAVDPSIVRVVGCVESGSGGSDSGAINLFTPPVSTCFQAPFFQIFTAMYRNALFPRTAPIQIHHNGDPTSIARTR